MNSASLVWKTYDDWKAAGFQVQRGERGQLNTNISEKYLFSNKQVKPSGRGMSNYDNVGDYDAEDYTRHWDDPYFDDIGDR